jgi:hypothetical protein
VIIYEVFSSSVSFFRIFSTAYSYFGGLFKAIAIRQIPTQMPQIVLIIQGTLSQTYWGKLPLESCLSLFGLAKPV